MKKILAGIGATIIGLGMLGSAVYADAQPGDVIVTLGQDLTAAQKNQVLTDMGVQENNVQIVYVTNQEEHKYLDQYIPSAEIGTKAISSAKITIGQPGTGLVVQTNNIDYVSNQMYQNALATAGVKDANVYVDAPFEVSGTGALTGIIKAYEASTGQTISDAQTQLANQEMATTAKLGAQQGVGQDKAAQFMQKVKEEISTQKPQTTDQLRALIQQVANEMGITLTPDQLNQLVDLFNKIKGLNIDWNKVGQTFQQAKQKWNQFESSKQGQNIIDHLISFLQSIWNGITSYFSKN
jgi:uncharacterized protein YpuA (DUF1002 family)